MSHISTDDLNAILSGETGPEAIRTLLAHLEAGCDTCEATLDGAVDIETLLCLVDAETGTPATISNDEAQQIWAAASPPAPRQNGRWSGAGVVLALAASAILYVGAYPAPNADSPDLGAVKGTELSHTDVSLRVLTGEVTSKGFGLTGRLAQEQRVSSKTTLLFELEANRPAFRYLFVTNETGKTTVLWPTSNPTTPEPPGRHRVSAGRNWVALQLNDWTGPLTVVGATSLSARSSDEIVTAYQLNNAADDVAFDTISASVVP